MSCTVADNGTQLTNHAGRLDWRQESVQAFVCSQCLEPRCESGGWVAPRKTELGVLLLPCFKQMAEDEWSEGEFGPPEYLQNFGIPLLSLNAAAQLAGDGDIESLHPLTRGELARLVQWEAPFQILDHFPRSPKIRRDDVLAVSAESVADTVAELERMLAAEPKAPVLLRELSETDEPVHFFLDDPGTTQWTPMAKTREGPSLLLNETIKGI